MSGAYYTQQRDMRGNPALSGSGKYSSASAVSTREVYPAGREFVTSWRSEDIPGAKINLGAMLSWDKYRSPLDTGHTFWSQKRFYTHSHTKFSVTGTSGSSYSGPLRIQAPTGGWPSDYLPVFKDPIAFNAGFYGPEAIAKTAPTKSRASLITAATEAFRDGIPQYIIGAGALKPKGIGHNALTNTFGWQPLISDVQKIVRSLTQASAMLRQLSRDDGRLVRRRLDFPLVESTEPVRAFGPTSYDLFPEVVGGFNSRLWISSSPTEVEHTCTTVERVSFSGAYVYRLPIPDSLLTQLQRAETEANYLLGIRSNAASVWEVIPFSWLIDWIANVGSGLAAATELASNGLVLHHGYLMRRTIRKDKITLRNAVMRNGGTLSSVSSGTITDTKERFQATPFGFGLNPSTFTEKQWAILAALGLSKSNRRVGW